MKPISVKSLHDFFSRPESPLAIANYVKGNLPKKTVFILDAPVSTDPEDVLAHPEPSGGTNQ